MGLRGKRQSATKKFDEPELIVGVNDIIKKAHDRGWYRGKSLDIESVISSFEGLVIRREQMPSNVSGYFKNENGKWIIGVNQAHHPNRQKFTMAHELGHYILHKEKDINIVDTTLFRNEESDSVEYMANEFASKLLMPEDEVRELVAEGVKNIGDLAECFGVSASAMKYRVLSMGYKLKDNV